MRIRRFSGVLAPVMRVASGDHTIRPSAKTMYDGTAERLKKAMRATAPVVTPHSMSHDHTQRTGMTARPHTIASTAMTATTVQPTRQIARRTAEVYVFWSGKPGHVRRSSDVSCRTPPSPHAQRIARDGYASHDPSPSLR